MKLYAIVHILHYVGFYVGIAAFAAFVIWGIGLCMTIDFDKLHEEKHARLLRRLVACTMGCIFASAMFAFGRAGDEICMHLARSL